MNMAVRKTATTKAEQAVEQTEPKFSKEQVLAAAKYRENRDLVDALLDDGEKYTLEQVDKMIEDYKKGMVK
jgi:hypothetical protein|nr:MAG TPA: hypothetical protein [Caudoviricetes sp.]